MANVSESSVLTAPNDARPERATGYGRDVNGALRPHAIGLDGGPMGPTASSRILSAAADTNATSAKASAGRLWRIQVNNTAGHVIYLKFYNKATAPTVGTDTPVITLALATGVNSLDMGGHYFATGIAYGCVVNAADNDTTALTAADFLGLNVQYS